MSQTTQRWLAYLSALKGDFIKLAKLEFLQPDGSVAFSVDNNPRNTRSNTFIAEGQLTVNLQNGTRRMATVTLANIDGAYEYSYNKVWFGQQIRLLMGLVLPSGEDFYLSQGVFYIKRPNERITPSEDFITYNLVDKWAYLDGTLHGNLDGIYEVPVNTNLFEPIASILQFDRGNGQVIDNRTPIFTEYYNDKTIELPDGSIVAMNIAPYTIRVDGTNSTYADVILELNSILVGWIGYDATGTLRLTPSQEDILDTDKPVQWQFSPREKQWLGVTYETANDEVYNDIIIRGGSLDNYAQVAGRASNYDPNSNTNINIIGRKTLTEERANYYSTQQCEDLAVFRLKRKTVLNKAVSISSTQLFHLTENSLVTIVRPDTGTLERHLIQGYSLPIGQTGEMIISAISVQDFPNATVEAIPLTP